MAKKYECTLPGMDSAETGQDVDAVITSRELCSMLWACHVNVEKLEDEGFNDLLGEGTGAAVIFGATGGVMEAALCSAYYPVIGQNTDPDESWVVRGMFGYRNVMNVEAFFVRLAEYFQESTEGIAEYVLTPEDIAAVNKLVEEKYGTWEWNFGKSPAYNYERAIRFPCALLICGSPSRME